MPQRFACSMPYGIRGWCSNRLASIGPNAGACSTPYGIRGWCRLTTSRLSRTAQASAQRLTASEDGAAACECCIPRIRQVLNALRHQKMVQV